MCRTIPLTAHGDDATRRRHAYGGQTGVLAWVRVTVAAWGPHPTQCMGAADVARQGRPAHVLVRCMPTAKPVACPTCRGPLCRHSTHPRGTAFPMKGIVAADAHTRHATVTKLRTSCIVQGMGASTWGTGVHVDSRTHEAKCTAVLVQNACISCMVSWLPRVGCASPSPPSEPMHVHLVLD